MGWRILLQSDDGHEYTSSSLASRQNALSFACDLLRAGELHIVEITGDAGEEIGLDEVAFFAEASKLARATRARV